MTGTPVHVLFVSVLVFVAALTAPVAAVDSSGPAAPLTVDTTFVGTSEASEHAVEVTVTVAPTDKTGPINNTVITINTEDTSFIDPSSISTNETTGGTQVVRQNQSRPTAFALDRMEPGERVTISFRVYPKVVLPAGETLATVSAQTQFTQTQRVVSETKPVAPVVDQSDAGYAVTPPISPVQAGGIGATVAAVGTLVLALVYRRQRRQTLCGLLRSAHEQAVSSGTKRAIEKILAKLGGDPPSSTTGFDTTTSETSDEEPLFDFDE
ncbi:hypothetical protein ACOZ4B_14350 [Haloferax prahovense]|uniref:hypothetical protein n=1 Tax=Haloferax prahovense TaxID=381852 RepID=UPI003C74CC22